MSETTAEYRVNNRNRNTNNYICQEFVSHGLDILKRAVLLVLYEDTDIIFEKTPYAQESVLKAGAIRERLGILRPQRVCASTNAFIQGVLDHLQHDGHAHHYLGQGWAITEKGVSVSRGMKHQRNKRDLVIGCGYLLNCLRT